MTAAPLRPLSRGWLLASCVPVLLVLGMAVSVPAAPSGSPQDGTASGSSGSEMAGMPGMAHPAGDPGAAGSTARGLAAEQDGHRLNLVTCGVPAGRPTAFRFTVTGPGGAPVTGFAVHQTKKLHFYAIRADLTGFQHLHPEMADDGTWTADLAALTPGAWRLYADFVPDTGPHAPELVLSRTVTVPGQDAPVPLPAPAGSTTVDGYTVELTARPMAGAHQLVASVSRDGRPVTDLQPYLDAYAHLSAFHEGDQALAHLHPSGTVDGDHGGPTLTFQALFAEPGDWRVFLQFRTAGQLHTAELTLHVD
ncbi:FixH family protein [Kitasatospora xanthocidica]|uniref:FixH family protein n=1 Tax=Kitasatospora xanthocidica TaxID=83382 RepID=UPI001E2A194F|nr:FixH family protein [Kitasatospora xanthocidica]